MTKQLSAPTAPVPPNSARTGNAASLPLAEPRLHYVIQSKVAQQQQERSEDSQ